MKFPSTSPRRSALFPVVAAFALLALPPIARPEETASRSDALRPVIENYTDLVYSQYATARNQADALRVAVDAFLDSPSDATQQAAKEAWIRAHQAYGPSEAFRFYNGPIDEPGVGPEGMINGWPLDEVYVDYVEGAPDSGIINRPALVPAIQKFALMEMNEKGGEENIATGFHAIEFLLWGQDMDDDGPGRRSYTDYLEGSLAPNPQRRSAYLRIVAGLLVEQLDQLCEAWSPQRTDNFRARFLGDDPHESLRKIFTGIGMLAGDELSSERMAVAYETRDQEDEQSCFSDTTHLDLIANARGIQNVYLGRYGEQDGPGLDELVRAADADLDRRLKKQIEGSIEALAAIPPPFDVAIRSADGSPARARVLAAIESVESAARLIVEAAETQGIRLNLRK